MKKLLKKSGAVRAAAAAMRAGVEDLRRIKWTLGRRGKIAAYLRAHPSPKLQIGTSKTPLPGWLNTDLTPELPEVVYLDATRPFPFADNVFDCVASEHMIEHVPHADGVAMLRECFRVLKPGGKIRLATPDLRMLAGLIAPEKTAQQKEYVDWIIAREMPEVDECRAVFVLNNAFRAWGHQFLFDLETLKQTMTQCGFENLKNFPPGESDDPALRGLEAHGRAVGNEAMNRFETIIVEGRVPAAKKSPHGKSQ